MKDDKFKIVPDGYYGEHQKVEFVLSRKIIPHTRRGSVYMKIVPSTT